MDTLQPSAFSVQPYSDGDYLAYLDWLAERGEHHTLDDGPDRTGYDCSVDGEAGDDWVDDVGIPEELDRDEDAIAFFFRSRPHERPHSGDDVPDEVFRWGGHPG